MPRQIFFLWVLGWPTVSLISSRMGSGYQASQRIPGTDGPRADRKGGHPSQEEGKAISAVDAKVQKAERVVFVEYFCILKRGNNLYGLLALENIFFYTNKLFFMPLKTAKRFGTRSILALHCLKVRNLTSESRRHSRGLLLATSHF